MSSKRKSLINYINITDFEKVTKQFTERFLTTEHNIQELFNLNQSKIDKDELESLTCNKVSKDDLM